MNTKQLFEIKSGKLDFLWLELTSRCNLQCVHCYADSEPNPKNSDQLSTEDYCNLITSAADLGCRKLQFIGGEPTLNQALPSLINHARASSFEFIEVFTNATRITDELLSCFIKNRVHVATSFYSHREAIHDSITQRAGSFSMTVKNINKLRDAGIPLRAGIIVMEQNRDTLSETMAFLKSLGIENIGTDRVRSFGRGMAAQSTEKGCSELSELCGSCWRGSACVAPDGNVSPCIMSKNWSVGSILQSDLATIVCSKNLNHIRQRIYDEVWLPNMAREKKNQATIHRSETTELLDCPPACSPNCIPSCNPQCSPNCSPCYPYGKCNPQLFGD